MQAPGEPRVGGGPFKSRRGHGLGDGRVDDSLAVRGSKADGLEIGAILAIKLLGNRHERGDGGRGLEVAQGDGDLATHGGGLILGHGLTEREDIATGGAESAEGHEAAGVIRRSEFLASERDAFIAELREQPDGTGSDERIGVGEESRNIVDDLVTRSLEAIEAAGADVRRRITQSGDLASGGGEIDLRYDRLEALRSNPIDCARQAVVAGAVAAHTGVEPIGDVDGTIRTDADVGRTELGLQDAGGLAAEEVGTSPLLLLVRGEEIEALEFHAGAIRLGQVSEDDVLAGFAGEEQSIPLRIQRAILIEGHASRRTSAVDIAGRHGAGVVLAPFGDRGLLSGTLIGTPGTLAVGRSEAGVAAFHDQGDTAGGRIVIIALVHVAKRVDRLLVAVAVVVTDDAGVRAVAVHAYRETADPDVTIVAAHAGHLLGVDGLLGELAMVIRAADAEGLARLVGELSAGVTLIEVPLAIRTEGRAVQ